MSDKKFEIMMPISLRNHIRQTVEHTQMHQALQTVLNTFGRNDGVLVTVQTKQHVLQNIRELLERIEHD
jgi:hypothetical protein